MHVFVQKTNRMVIKTWTKFSQDLVEINAFSVISEALNLKIMRGSPSASRKPRAFGALLHATGRPYALLRINALIKRLFCFIDVSLQHLVMLKDRQVNESWRRGFSPFPCWLQITFASSRPFEVRTVGVEGEQWIWMGSRWLDIGQVHFYVFIDWDKVEVNKNAKKERGQYPAILTEKSWALLFCGTNAGNPARARWIHLAAPGSQSEHRTRLIFVVKV